MNRIRHRIKKFFYRFEFLQRILIIFVALYFLGLIAGFLASIF